MSDTIRTCSNEVLLKHFRGCAECDRWYLPGGANMWFQEIELRLLAASSPAPATEPCTLMTLQIDASKLTDFVKVEVSQAGSCVLVSLHSVPMEKQKPTSGAHMIIQLMINE